MLTKKKLTLVTMAIGIFLCMLDTTVMNIALPAIQNGLHTDLNTLQWALNIYTVTFAAFTIPLGRIADIYGRNRIYLFGLMLFLAGSIVSAMAGSVAVLIGGRGLQSLGAAIVFPASMTIGINAVSAPERSGAVLVLGVTQGLAAAFGPTIGGLTTQFLSWRGIFLINVPLGLLALGLCLWLLPLRNESRMPVAIDAPGMVLGAITLFSLTLALVQGSAWGWFSLRTLAVAALFAITLVLFIWREARAAQPMIPLSLFRDRNFTGAVIVTVLAGIFFVSLMVILPSYFTKIQGHSELLAALMITPASAMVFICSPISGVLLPKIGPRRLIGLGALLFFLGYLGLDTMNPNHYWQVAIACLLVGAAYGIIIGPLTVLSAGNFTGALLTASQSVIGVFRQIGTVLAVAIFVSALSANLAAAKTSIWHDTQQSVATLTVTSATQATILHRAHTNLFAGEMTAATTTPQPAVRAQQRRALINQATATYLQQHQGTHWPAAQQRAVHAKVAAAVTTRVSHTNHAVRAETQRIRRDVKSKLTAAFFAAYKVATPFLLLMALAVLIFPRRNPATN